MQIIGHRGARGEAPENTLGGFRYLADLGIRAVEFDVRQLQDQELVVIHDDNFLRTVGVDQMVESLQLADMHQYDHRHLWQDWQQPEPTPALQHVLRTLQDFQHLEVEIKSVKDDAAAERLVERLEQTLQGLEHSATITSFDTKILAALQRSKSQFKRGLLIELPFGEYAIESALQYGCSRIGWKDILATDQLIKATHHAKLDVSVWTVNDLKRAKELRDFGVQGLITDYPKLMLGQL